MKKTRTLKHPQISSKKKDSLLSLFGANKGNDLYKDAKEIYEYIYSLRNEWEETPYQKKEASL